MAWYEEAVFYHIYPLGLTGAPKQNSYEDPVHRLNSILPWISHIRKSDVMPFTSDRFLNPWDMATKQLIIENWTADSELTRT